MSTPASSVFSQYFPRTAKLANNIAHPLDALSGLLGLSQPAPMVPPPAAPVSPPINWQAYQQADAQNRAQPPAAAPIAPANAAARKKYPGMMSGGQ